MILESATDGPSPTPPAGPGRVTRVPPQVVFFNGLRPGVSGTQCSGRNLCTDGLNHQLLSIYKYVTGNEPRARFRRGKCNAPGPARGGRTPRLRKSSQARALGNLAAVELQVTIIGELRNLEYDEAASLKILNLMTNLELSE
eukprot:437708-Hanusia_phi.AAC.1